MSNYNLTCLAIFGMLFIVTVVTVSSQLFPVTKIVSATTTTPSGANETGTSSNNMTGATFLFIQGAESGSVDEINATASTLELGNVSDKTILFSDRPYRLVASVDTSDFIGNWSSGGFRSFAINPPNVALVVHDDVEQRQDLAVIELFNPEFDPVANTLRYDIVSENGTSINLPNSFGQSTLVIDNDVTDLMSQSRNQVTDLSHQSETDMDQLQEKSNNYNTVSQEIEDFTKSITQTNQQISSNLK